MHNDNKKDLKFQKKKKKNSNSKDYDYGERKKSNI